MALVDEVAQDLLEKYGWTVVVVDDEAKTVTVTKNTQTETIPYWMVRDIIKDTITTIRIDRKKNQLQNYILQGIQQFETDTSLSVDSVNLAKADGVTTGASVEVNYKN